MLGLLVVGILIAGSPGYGQEPDPGASPAVPVLNGSGPEVVPIVTRAGAHDDFGRIVFDWPWTVAYGAQIEGKTLTVMFDRHLHTTFQEIPRNLGAYITDVELGPDGQSVIASLTDEYRLRTFILNNSENEGVKVVVDLLADGEAGPIRLAQAPVLPLPEPSPEAVPGDVPSPSISGDSPLPPSLPFAAEAAAEPTSEDTPPAEAEAAPVDVPLPLPEGEAEAVPPAETVKAEAAPLPGGETVPPSPPDEPANVPPVKADEAMPPAETEVGADLLPEGEGSEPATVGVPPTETEAPPPAEAAPATKDTAPVTTDPTPESLTPSSQIPTLPVSVRIPVSQSRLFRLDTPVASVFVANPDIADVQLVSSGVLFVVAKAVGRTSVAALDADSDLVGQWTIATVLDIQPARVAIEGVPALKNVVVRQLNRGVELSGTVASIATADLALRLTTTALPEETPVENRISVTGKQQVNLEVQIAEVQRSVSETLGFNWEVLPDIGVGRGLGMRVGRFFFSEATGFISQGLPGGRAAALFGSTGISPGRTTVQGLIDALATAGLATVLARPNVTAISGETASFFSGGEYPLPSGFEDGAIIFEYKKYGVLLDFVPTIIDSERIMLTVRPEVSQRSDTDSLTVVGIEIPVINVRRAETTVEVGDGESIVIAGLYRDQSEAVEAGLPVIKDIPLLGMLFGTQSVRSNATELIVVVTARLTTATTMPRTTDRDRQLPGRRLRGYHY